jgi:hypothetical protein
VPAANYDTGGQGAAYNVTSVNGAANSYRSDGVDLETCTDTGCGDDLGWTSQGQWFRYTINVASAGSYTVSFRVASASGVSDAFHIADTVAGRPADVDQDNGGWNSRYMSFASASGSSGSALAASPSSLSFGSVAVGSASGTLSAASSAPGSPLTVALSGTATSPGSNLAQGRPVTASGYSQNYGPANAVDGNTSTYWESTNNAFPQWLQADLGSAVSIGRIVMDLPPSSAWGTRSQTITI